MHTFEIAPSGTPIRFSDLLGWLWSLPRAGARLEMLRAELSRRYGIRHCFFVSSGRAGMVVLLRAMRALASPEKDTVIVPSYTCYSVPASVIRAGLRVRIIDVDPATLSYRLDQLAGTDFTNVLAIVSSSLYGVPNELAKIADIARRNAVQFIDDAAQSLGATLQHQAVGTFGDAGLFSLDKGKNITSIQGGILVTQSDTLAGRINEEMASLPPAPPHRTLGRSIQLLVYAIFLRPWLYWIPSNLPFLRLGITRYEIDYPIEHYSPILGIIAERLFRRIDDLTDRRRGIASALENQLAGLPALRCIRPPDGARPAYVRFPVLLATPEQRDRLLGALQAAGYGATGSYPLSIVDIPEIAAHLDCDRSHAAAGREIAARILTLPTHPYVRPKHVAQICSIIRRELR